MESQELFGQETIEVVGFDYPEANWSKLPHQLIEWLPLINTAGELKVLLYVLRHTWGFQEYEDWDIKCITADEFLNGRKRADGTRLDNGIGVSKVTLIAAIKKAIEHEFIVKYVDNTDKGRVRNYYRLRYEEDEVGVIYAFDPNEQGGVGKSPWHSIALSTRKKVYRRFQGRCAYCEKKSRRWHFDHIVPRAQGGPGTFDNLALSCPQCNMVKGSRTPDEWGRPVIVYVNDERKIYLGWRDFLTGTDVGTGPRTEVVPPLDLEPTPVPVLKPAPRTEKETKKETKKEAAHSRIALAGVTIFPPDDTIQTEYVEVLLTAHSTEIICPECNHRTEWPKSQRLRKKTQVLTCGECGVYYKVSVESDYGNAQTYKVPLPKQDWCVKLDDAIPHIGDRLYCDEEDAMQFAANWEEDPSRVVEKLQWAATQQWALRQRNVFVKRVNTAYETSMKGVIAKETKKRDNSRWAIND